MHSKVHGSQESYTVLAYFIGVGTGGGGAGGGLAPPPPPNPVYVPTLLYLDLVILQGDHVWEDKCRDRLTLNV